MNVVHGEKPPAPWYFATAAPAFDGPFSSAWLTPNCGSLFPGVICHNPHPVVAYGWPCCTAPVLNPDSAPVMAAAMWAMKPPGPPAPIHQSSICRRLAFPRLPAAFACADLIPATVAAAVAAWTAATVAAYSLGIHGAIPGSPDSELTTPPDAKPGTLFADRNGAIAGTRCVGTTASPGIAMIGTLSLPGTPPVTRSPFAPPVAGDGKP